MAVPNKAVKLKMVQYVNNHAADYLAANTMNGLIVPVGMRCELNLVQFTKMQWGNTYTGLASRVATRLIHE